MLKELNDNNVDAVLSTSRTFIVLFYNNNLPNIPNIMEVFKEFDEQFKGKIDVYTCDVDQNKRGKIATYFGMNTLPAMVMMKNNKPYANIAGPASRMKYQELVKQGIMAIMAGE